MLSGNEAIARGAFEAGVRVAAGYPGTPSTEILENIVQYERIYSEWSPNEKVALEVAIGSALGGARSLATMKHVGLNVAADPLLTISYTGINAGLVVVSADDPGMHSSQNEQDNRYYARLAKIPMLEPSDSQEAKDFVIRAFEISEKFDTPVLLRTTTRINHGKSVVRLGEPIDPPVGRYEKDAQKYVMIPLNARKRRVRVEERFLQMKEYSDGIDLNFIEWGDKSVGIITSGIAYQYAKEAAPNASFLKLGMTFPLPETLIREFVSQIETLYVVEELDPFLEVQIKALGIEAIGKERFPIIGELSPKLVYSGLNMVTEVPKTAAEVPPRPPVMCPGCPHRGFFYTLKKYNAAVLGDIGCYSLSALPPIDSMDTCICMGAAVSSAIGVRRAMPEGDNRPVVAVLGDSTFIHSGITGLVDAVYNNTPIVTCILDNSTTAMTGGQENPTTGKTLSGQPAPKLDLRKLALAIGIEDVMVVDPHDLDAVNSALKYAFSLDKPSVIITSRPCVLIDRKKRPAVKVDSSKCTGCRVCFKLGCPALESSAEGGPLKAKVNSSLCSGCGVCVQVCRQEAIGRTSE